MMRYFQILAKHKNNLYFKFIKRNNTYFKIYIKKFTKYVSKLYYDFAPINIKKIHQFITSESSKKFEQRFI